MTPGSDLLIEAITTMNENAISKTNNLLLVLGEQGEHSKATEALAERFCGVVERQDARVNSGDYKRVYVCGDIGLLSDELVGCRVIEDLSSNVPADLEARGHERVTSGQVPLSVHCVGVLYERFFEEEELFKRIQGEHEFQHLTESTKQSKALRTGIYLTDITREVDEQEREVLRYRLLRCSSNLTGPTDNFRETDRMIMRGINDAARDVFEQETSLNHVLAQIYENTKDDDERGRERKAKISAHSDKTKDMREDGLIAFCTFYDPEGFEHLAPSDSDPRDWCYKSTSGLTRLRFKLKPDVDEPGLAKTFEVTLYPNSVFIIPLSTNRLYTHAIKPSHLNVDRIPTRMGYVARSSKAEALFVDGQTFLEEDGTLRKLEPMTRERLAALRDSYYKENATADEVAYGEVRFSMNQGDYQKPIL